MTALDNRKTSMSFRSSLLLVCVFWTLSPGPAAAETALFSAPDTPAGWIGKDGLVAHGMIDHPRGFELKPAPLVPWNLDHLGQLWSEENVDAAFWEANSQSIGLLVTINNAGKFGPTFRYSSFWLATSEDESDFPFEAWSEIFWTDPEVQDLRIHHPSVFPDPRNPAIYSIIFSVTERLGSETVSYTSRAAIHVGIGAYKVLTTEGWSPIWIDWGQQLTLGAGENLLDVGGVPKTRMTRVDGEYQQWRGRAVDRSGAAPCDPLSEPYKTNTQNHTGGLLLTYQVYDWKTRSSGSLRDVQLPVSSPNGHKDLATDYGGSMAPGFEWGENLQSIVDVRLWDYGDETILYYSSTDLRVCTFPYSWNPWSGAGVKALRMNRDGQGRYSLAGTSWLLNVRYPNWSCGPEIIRCEGDNERSYAFVGVMPLKPPGSERVLFFTPVWGGFTFE